MKSFKSGLITLCLITNAIPQSGFSVETTNELQSSLIKALKSNDTVLTRALLDSLPSGAPSSLQTVNQVDESGKSSLILAIQAGSGFDILRRLLEKGANVNQADAEGKTPLFYAAQKGQLTLMQALLKKGAEQDSTVLTQAIVSISSTQWSSMQSSEQELFQLLKLFIENGAQLDLTFPSSRSAYLDPRSYDRFHDLTLFTWTIESRLPRLTDYLLTLKQKADKTSPGQLQAFVNEMDGRGRTPLIQAAESGNFGLIRTLLDNGATPNAIFPADHKKFAGRSLMSWAIENDRAELISVLLERGADLGPPDALLMSAIERGNLEMVKLAIERGAAVCPDHSTHPSSHTPLTLASERGKLEVVRLLLDSVSAESTSAAASITQNECDLNTPGKVGRSALAWTTNLNIALLLLDKGENQYLGAPHLRTVLTLATSQGLTPLIKKWIEFFSRVQTTTSLEQILSLKSESTIAFEGTIVANQSPQLLASISDLKTLMNMRAKELYYQQREREILGPSQVPGSGRMEIDEPLEASNCLSCSDPSVGARQFGPAGCECYLCPDCAPPFCDMVVNRDGEEQSKCPGCKKPVYSKYLVQQGRTEAEAVKIRNRIVDQQNAQQLGWRFCPTQGCAGGRVVQPQEKSAFYSCLLCGHDGCIKCGKEHHGDCSNYAQQLKEFENLLKLGAEMPPEVRPTDPNHRDYLKGRYRPCYHCGVITERIDGCNHMKCGRCKKDWHWNNGPHSTSDRERNKMKFKPLQAPHF